MAAIRSVSFIVAMLGAGVFLLGASSYPPGLSDGTANPAHALVRGVYAGSDAGDCCWLGKDAAWKISPPAGATSAIVTIFVEPYAPFAHALQSLAVRVGAGPVTNACCYGPGIHQFPVALPAHRSGEVLIMQAHAAISFIPAELHLNNDTRRLSVLLRNVEFRSADGSMLATSVSDDRTAKIALYVYLVIGIAVFMLARKRPIYALAALIILEPLGSETAIWHTTIVPFKAALIGALLGLAFRPGWGALLRDRRALLLTSGALALACASLVSLVHATYHEPVFRETLKALEYALTFVVAYVAMRSDPDERIARGAFAATAVIVCIGALAQEVIGAPEGAFIFGHEVARIAGPLEGPNQLAAWLGIVAPVALTFFTQMRAIAGLAVVTEILTLSRGGAIGLMAAVAAVFARSVRAGWALAIAGIGVVGLLALRLGIHAVPGEVDKYNGGLGTRADLWHTALSMFRAHPISGVGAGNYELLLGSYGLLGIRTHANSWYFQGAAEGGVAMLLAIAFVIIVALAVFARSRNGFALAAFAASIGFFIHQIVDDLVFYPKVAAMWWLLLGLAAAVLARDQETADSSIVNVPAPASSVAESPTGNTH